MPRRSHWTVTASLAVLALAACSMGHDTGLPPPAGAADGDDPRCAGLAGRVFDDARVTSAVTVRAGRIEATPGQVIADLPPLCRIEGVATPTPRSRIGFEVWLPLEGWSGRIHMVGNGGYSAAIRHNLLGALARRGDVAVATDTGHAGDELSFGFDNRDAIADWGHRAVHRSITAGKRLTTEFYGGPARWSYFSGCSTGGHQGLMSAQRYPGDFDGIIAGAPGNNRTNLNFGFLWQFLSNHPPGDNRTAILDREDLRLASQAALAACDALDGVADGVVNDPRRCRFDVGRLRCAPGQEEGCLIAPKIEALNRMQDGARRADTGETVYPGWPLLSAFVEGQGLSEGWHNYWANPRRPEEPQRVDYFRRWVFDDPAWNWWNFDWTEGVDRARAVMGALTDAVDPDLDAFRRGGGKLILFTGWQDPVVSAHDVIAYHEAVTARRPDAGDFARLFMIPGMGHCALGPGATHFSTSTRNSTPAGTDAAHDVTAALERWVEQGEAPSRITAVHYRDGRPENGVRFARPLCPWPQAAAYDGRGDPDRADSFTCR